MSPRVLLVLLCALLAPGCLLIQANRNVKTLGKIVTVKGSIEATLPAGRPAFVVLLREGEKGWETQSSRVLYQSGSFEFLTRPGKVSVYAFIDADGDSTWAPEEAAASAPPAELADGATLDVGTLTLAAKADAPPIALTLGSAGVSEELVKVHRGDGCRLDEERFTETASKLGFWQPADFALKYGVGISFLEPYDPQRTPVILVHGAEGTPAHFTKVIAALDRTKYQVWVFSYPSGIRLELAARTLTRITDDLQLKLGFKRVLVIAHSMGGLVARSFVAGVAARGDAGYVRMLVTISTPFDGHESAQFGVDHSPVVVPSWLDMAAGSPFLLTLRTPLPAKVPHHVFFSFFGGTNSTGPTDGTVSVRSMLEPGIQEGAALVRGFPETHMSILSSPALFSALNASLAQAAP